jgi:hypothetical protein
MKGVNNVSIEKWKKAFAKAVDIAIDKDYFFDILYHDLFPEVNEIEVSSEEEAMEYGEAIWEYFNEAFYETFGIDREFLYN